MANKVIDPAPIIKQLADRCLKAKGLECSVLGSVIDLLKAAPAVDDAPYWATEAAYKNGYEAGKKDAVEVVRIDEVKREILQTLDTLVATHRDISNSQFSDYENHLDIPKSSNDYYGIKAEAYETARRLVNAALNDLCTNCGAKRDGDGNG